MVIGVKVFGASALKASLEALGDSLTRPVMREALHRAGEPMRAAMTRNAPPRSRQAPHIADSIAISDLRTLDGVALDESEAAVAIGPTKDVFYASFLEHGWLTHPGRPFIRPAYDEHADKAMALIGRELWGAISRASSTRSTTFGGV